MKKILTAAILLSVLAVTNSVQAQTFSRSLMSTSSSVTSPVMLLRQWRDAPIWASHFNATSSTATSTFAGDITFNNAYGIVLPLQDTAANLASVVPQSGQRVYETDTGFTKVGDGSTTVANLRPFNTQWTTNGTNVYYNTGNVGIGTTSPYAKLSVTGEIVANNFTATSTVATTTLFGGISARKNLFLSAPDLTGQTESGSDLGAAPYILDVRGGRGGSDTQLGYMGSPINIQSGPGGRLVGVSDPSVGGPSGTVRIVTNDGGSVTEFDTNYDHTGGRSSDLYFGTGLGGHVTGGVTTFGGDSGNILFMPGDPGTTTDSVDGTTGTRGKIGIGTSTPWRTLSVYGSSDLGVNALAGTFTATSTATSTFEGPIEIDYLKTTSITATSSITKFLQVGTTSPVANASTTKTLYIEGAANNYNAPSAGILQINSLGDADSPGTSDFSRNRGLFFGIDTNTVSNAGSGFIQYYGGTGINPARNLALNPNGGGVVINGIFGETSSSFPLSVVGNTGANSLVKIQNISTGGGTLTTPYAGLTFQTYTTVNTYEKGGIIVQDMEGGSCCYLRQKMRFLLNPTASNANVQDTVEGSTIMTLAYKNGYGTASNLTNPVVGIGSTTPYAKLSVHALSNETNDTLFAVASSTASATTTHFVIKATGETGIGTTSPYAKLSVVGPVVASYIHATSTTATSTFSGHLVQGTNIVSSYLYPSFTYATSTAWTGTTTIPLGVAFNGETWRAVKCFTDTGTLNVSINDGSNRMNMFNASTTVGNITLSTNNQFTSSEKRYVDIGTPASSPTKVSCTVQKTLDIE